ncbi:DUF6647 family protein [Billgrantia antri]|uniref:DUF6647 family protein n=1 Tax=Billgrantia antri TaxID=2846777 RepID=UPI003BEF0B12
MNKESQEALQKRCFPGWTAGLPPRVLGVYDPATSTIYLDQSFNTANLLDRSYLLHELVHHVQLSNGSMVRSRSKGYLEGQALRLQLAWLREQGVADPMSLLGIDERTIRIIEACPR